MTDLAENDHMLSLPNPKPAPKVVKPKKVVPPPKPDELLHSDSEKLPQYVEPSEHETSAVSQLADAKANETPKLQAKTNETQQEPKKSEATTSQLHLPKIAPPVENKPVRQRRKNDILSVIKYNVTEDTEEDEADHFEPRFDGDVPPPPSYLTNAINESPFVTIGRDLLEVALRSWVVCNIFSKKQPIRNVYEQFDIFGPLFISISFWLLLQVSLAYNYAVESLITMVLSIYFIFGFFIGLNIVMLKGRSNILGIICICSYMTIPFVFGQILIFVVNIFKFDMSPWLQNILVLLISGLAVLWVVLVAKRIFRRIVPKHSIFMGYYPVALFIIIMACFQIVLCLYRPVDLE